MDLKNAQESAGSRVGTAAKGDATSTGPRHQLRQQLRQSSYEEGRSLLKPETPAVQMRGDETTKKNPPVPTVTPSGTLWPKDEKGNDKMPSVEDVRQGSAGDCYFFAAMAATVHANPRLIKNMIKDNGDGTYTVTFGIQEGILSWIGKGTQVTETVSLAYKKGEKRGRVSRTKALWPLVLERAWAKHKGGIKNIEGGKPGEGVEVLTGKGVTRIGLSGETADDVVKKAKAALDAKQPVTLYGGQGKGTKKQKSLAKGTAGLYLKHSYAIIGVRESSKELKLYNPWGSSHPNGDGWVKADVVRKFFSEMHINK